MTLPQQTLRWAEMLALFVGGPVLLWSFPGVLGGGRLFGFLMLMGVVCTIGLYFDKHFERKKLWNAGAVPPALGWLVVRWVIASMVLLALFGLFAGRELPGLAIAVPTGLFRLFNRQVLPPGAVDAIVLALSLEGLPTWLCAVAGLIFSNLQLVLPVMITLLYPWVSVYPQNVIFRAFFIQRYRPILGGGWALILVNAAAFSFGHVMFNNWIVLLLTFIGGIIFTRTYLRSDSLLLAVIEHAMYGIFCFYLGIGVFLLYGASG